MGSKKVLRESLGGFIVDDDAEESTDDESSGDEESSSDDETASEHSNGISEEVCKQEICPINWYF